MANLPPKTDLTGGTTTEAQFQAALGNLYDFLAQIAVATPPESVEIELGTIEPERCLVIMDTENTSASDDLEHILATNVGAKTIFLRITSSSRPITLKHQVTGSGKISLATGGDVLMDHPNQMIALTYDLTSAQWVEMWRSWGVFAPTAQNKADVRTLLGLGPAALLDVGTGAPGNLVRNQDLGALAYLGSITSSAMLATGVVTNDKVATGTLNINKLANGPVNTLLGFNASGIPFTLSGGGDVNKVLRGDLTFGVLTSTMTAGANVIAVKTLSPNVQIGYFYSDPSSTQSPLRNGGNNLPICSISIPKTGSIRINVKMERTFSPGDGFRKFAAYVYKNGVFQSAIESDVLGTPHIRSGDFTVAAGDLITLVGSLQGYEGSIGGKFYEVTVSTAEIPTNLVVY